MTTTEKTKPVFTEDELREIRERCAAIKTEAEARLPEGEAGLLEAERRLAILKARYHQIIGPLLAEQEEEAADHLGPAQEAIDELVRRVDTTPPETSAGLKAKLRRLLDPDGGIADFDTIYHQSLQQIADFIARETGRQA